MSNIMKGTEHTFWRKIPRDIRDCRFVPALQRLLQSGQTVCYGRDPWYQPEPSNGGASVSSTRDIPQDEHFVP